MALRLFHGGGKVKNRKTGEMEKPSPVEVPSDPSPGVVKQPAATEAPKPKRGRPAKTK